MSDQENTPREPRAGTALILRTNQVELEINEPEALATFLEHAAHTIRCRKRITLIVE